MQKAIKQTPETKSDGAKVLPLPKLTTNEVSTSESYFSINEKTGKLEGILYGFRKVYRGSDKNHYFPFLASEDGKLVVTGVEWGDEFLSPHCDIWINCKFTFQGKTFNGGWRNSKTNAVKVTEFVKKKRT